MMKAQHSPVRMGLIVGVVLLFTATIAFVSLWIVSARIDTGIFLPDTGAEESDFESDIGPANWVFWIVWSLIFLWQILWILYLLTTTCRSREGEYLYISPDNWPPAIFVLFMINNCANISWVFLRNRKMYILEMIPITILPLSLYPVIALSAKRLTENSAKMVHLGLKADIWCVRLLAHNGLATYATWATIAMLLDTVRAFSVSGKLEQDIISTACFAVLLVLIVCWFIADIFFLDRWVRYMATPYFVCTFALVGIVYDHQDFTKRNSIVAVVLLGLAAVCFIVKIIVMSVRHRKYPLLEFNNEKLES